MASGSAAQSARFTTTSKKIQKTNAEVNEIVDIMRINVKKVIERDEKLMDLGARADDLEVDVKQFEIITVQEKQERRQQWWKNVKMWILLGIIAAVLIIIIIVVAVVTSQLS